MLVTENSFLVSEIVPLMWVISQKGFKTLCISFLMKQERFYCDFWTLRLPREFAIAHLGFSRMR